MDVVCRMQHHACIINQPDRCREGSHLLQLLRPGEAAYIQGCLRLYCHPFLPQSRHQRIALRPSGSKKSSSLFMLALEVRANNETMSSSVDQQRVTIHWQYSGCRRGWDHLNTLTLLEQQVAVLHAVRARENRLTDTLELTRFWLVSQVEHCVSTRVWSRVVVPKL